jgi:hypothetical protein
MQSIQMRAMATDADRSDLWAPHFVAVAALAA